MANPNIVNVTSILGVTNLTSSVSTGAGSTLVSAVATGHVYKLNNITVANKTSSVATVTIAITRSSTDYNLAYQIPVPANSSLNVIGKDMLIYLQEGDSIKGIAGTSTALDSIVSYEDIS